MQHSPRPVAPYCGQNQTSIISVPAPIAYKGYQYAPEESCWSMPPYAAIFPQQQGLAFVPPPVYLTDIFSAQQTWPL